MASASLSPSASPSLSPSISPSLSPSRSPSMSPSSSPSLSPSMSPSLSPSMSLSLSFSLSPSSSPSKSPSSSPSVSPSLSPSETLPWEGSFTWVRPLGWEGTSFTSSSSGEFNFPTPTFQGTSPTSFHSNGQFVFPVIRYAGTSHTGSIGSFVFPMIHMSSIAPDHSIGQFNFSLMAYSGYGRLLPISRQFLGIVMNLVNQAISTRTNFPFNSLAKHKGKYYGATHDAIYLLEGVDDNGTPINAHLKTGSMDFGEQLIKYARDIWITHRTDGHLALVIYVDEDNATLIEKDTQIVSDEIREERLKPPRGLRGRFYTIELSNILGANFDMDSFSILVETERRKIR